MKEPKIRPPGTRRERWARRLKLDHNPLRRPADRLEAWLRLAMLALVVTAVPAATIMAGHIAGDVLGRQARAQQAADHHVSAVLTQRASTSAIDPYVADPDTFVQARWTAPDGAARSGQILAPGGTPAGQIIPIWVNEAGTIVSAPPQHEDVVTGTIVYGVVSGLVLTVLLMVVETIAEHALDRRRLGAWDNEWRATGPIWTGHRS